MKYILFILFSFLIFSSSLYSQKISSINFDGLKTTKKLWLNAQMLSKTGQNFDQSLFDRDIQYLRDLNLFLGVYGKTKIVDSGIELNIYIEEALYFYPIIGLENSSHKTKLKIGGSYDNFLGIKGKIGGFFEFYDKLSFVFYHDIPLHYNNRTGHFCSSSYRSTIEPVQYEDENYTVDFSLFTIGGGGYYHWKPKLYSSIGFQYFKESYATQFKESLLYNDGNNLTFNKLQFITGLKHNQLHYKNERLSGFSWNIDGEYIKTIEFNNSFGNFFKFSGSFKTFLNLLKNQRDNIAIRFQFGLASNGNIPIPPFYIDNFTNVRGAGDRVARGTAQCVINLEYRYLLWTHPWFYLQSNLFSDISSLRSNAEGINTILNKKNMFWSGGIGFRVHMRKFYQTVLRVDYSIPILNANGGFVFGIGQYF